jgi:ABC-type glycerol-3-phosphate transport system substrate-binding protein
VRKATLISLLLVAVLALAACGGGGSSSSGGSTSGGSGAEETAPEEGATAASPEEAWAEEVTAVMTEFENKVTPTVIEPIHTSTAQIHLEPLYSVYSVDLSVLAKKLEATKAPAACVANRKKMASITSQVAALTKTLASNPKLNAEQYSAKAYEKGLKIDKLGHALGTLTAEPSC